MSPDDERRAIEEVIERLAVRFPDAGRDRVAASVQQAHHDLDGTPIRDFVPVLVEREARERLNHLVS